MIVTWNTRGMNASEKQRDVVDFVYKNKVGLVGLLETKLKKEKLNSIHLRFFQSWSSIDNCAMHPRSRIWVLGRAGEFHCH